MILHNDIHIELFAVHKSCEQGCVHCPMAIKDDAPVTAPMDPEVQRSFSLFESVLHTHECTYNFHCLASPQHFPVLEHPERVDMARFGTQKGTRELKSITAFSEKIRSLLDMRNVSPKKIGISYVPTMPLICHEDAQAIGHLIDAVGSWYFKQPGRQIEITIRSNLVAMKLFNAVLSNLHANDETHLVPLMNAVCTNVETELNMPKGRSVYSNTYKGETGRGTIVINNRVIGYEPFEDKHETYIAQAEHAYQISYVIQDFMIAPKGVMLEHNSLAINNPVLWMSHADFRSAIEREHGRDGFTVQRFVRLLLSQNVAIYKSFLKGLADQSKLTQKSTMHIFEYYRPQLEAQDYKLYE